LKKELWDSSFELAKTLFPLEEWIPTESNIWVAKSRFEQKIKEPEKQCKSQNSRRIKTSL